MRQTFVTEKISLIVPKNFADRQYCQTELEVFFAQVYMLTVTAVKKGDVKNVLIFVTHYETNQTF